jgi:hypothetical protein
MELWAIGCVNFLMQPDNAFIDYSGRLVLGDFGLAVDGMRLQSTENAGPWCVFRRPRLLCARLWVA